MTDHWMIYSDPPRKLYDAVPDPGFCGDEFDGVSAIGSNWQMASKEEAEEFLSNQPEGWSRGHSNAPRF